MLQDLPERLLREILMANSSNDRAVENFALICSRFRNIVANTPPIWTRRFRTAFPAFFENLFDSDRTHNYFGEFKVIYNLKQRILEKLQHLQRISFDEGDLADKDFAIFDDILAEGNVVQNYLHYLLGEIAEIYNGVPGCGSHHSITYCAQKAREFIEPKITIRYNR